MQGSYVRALSLLAAADCKRMLEDSQPFAITLMQLYRVNPVLPSVFFGVHCVEWRPRLTQMNCFENFRESCRSCVKTELARTPHGNKTFCAHFHTVSLSHFQMLFCLLRPWREDETQFLERASISADTARCHFLAQFFFMFQIQGFRPLRHLQNRGQT